MASETIKKVERIARLIGKWERTAFSTIVCGKFEIFTDCGIIYLVINPPSEHSLLNSETIASWTIEPLEDWSQVTELYNNLCK